MKQDQLQRLLLISAFAVSIFVQGQISTVSKTIYLQPNESYNLLFEDYLQFPASQFSYPQDFPPESIRNPFQQFDANKSTGALIKAIATIEDGLTTKYLIGHRDDYNSATKTYNIVLVYYSVQIDSETGFLTRSVISEKIFLQNISIPDPNETLYEASFYSLTQGFITFNSFNGSRLLARFQQSSKDGLVITNVNQQFSQYIGVHASFKDPNGNIFIIYLERYSKMFLYAYIEEQNYLALKDYQQFSETAVTLSLLINNKDSMLLFDINERKLFYVTADFTSYKLVLSSVDIQIDYAEFNSINTQYFGDQMLISICSDKSTFVYKLKVSQFMNNNQLQIQQIVKLDWLASDQDAFMMDENHFVYFTQNSFSMFSLFTQKIIFTKQYDQSTQYRLNPQEFIRNQIFVNDAQNADGTYNFIPVKFQIPSVLLSGQNAQYTFQLLSNQPDYGINLLITVEGTQEQKTSISQSNVEFWNYIPQVTNNTYYLPVETYVTGSNLNPSFTSGASYVKNISYNKLLNLQIQQSYESSQFLQSYPTDGPISSIIVSAVNNNIFTISAATPNITVTQNPSTVGIFEASPVSSKISLIDNYGTFILEQQSSQTQTSIFVPFINQRNLVFNQIQIQKCDNNIFSFASDPSQNVLFVLCGQQIQQFSYSYNSNKSQQINNAFILSQTTLTINFSASQLICINGNLFIYSNTQIGCYNYIKNGMLSSVIQVPKLSDNQKLFLFRETFIIAVQENPVKTIAQYSYGNFLSTNPKFMRNLFIDANHPISPSLSTIQKRNEIEYLFLQTINTNEYIIYRVNAPSSQNQLYTPATIPSNNSNIPIISSNAICILSQTVTCQQIYEQGLISYQLAITDQQFNSFSQLANLNQITLSIGDQKLDYNLQIVRKASTKYGTYNQNNAELQKFRAYLQDANLTNSTSYSLVDYQIYNNCLLGWDTYRNGFISLKNRINQQGTESNKTAVSYIMYNLKVSITSNIITFGNNLITYQDANINNECKLLDDQASKKIITSNSFSINVYTFCKNTQYNFSMKFVTTESGQYESADIAQQSQQKIIFNGDFSTYQKIITVDGQLLIFNLHDSLIYSLQYDQQQQANIISPYYSPTDMNNFNIIYSLSAQLTFFGNGVIFLENTKDPNNKTYSMYQLKDLLTTFSFAIDQSVKIQTIQQFSDNYFLIQLSNGVMFGVSFKINDLNQLILEEASLYYYQDGIYNPSFILKGGKYSFIFGSSIDSFVGGTYPTVLLYTNDHKINNQYLIESSYEVDSWKDYFTFAELISENQIKCYLRKGGSVTVSISDQIEISFMTNTFYINEQFNIYPISLQGQNQLNFVIQPYVPNSKTNSFILSFSIIILLSAVIAYI